MNSMTVILRGTNLAAGATKAFANVDMIDQVTRERASLKVAGPTLREVTIEVDKHREALRPFGVKLITHLRDVGDWPLEHLATWHNPARDGDLLDYRE